MRKVLLATFLGSAAAHFEEQGVQDACARSADGVANRDRAAIDVHLAGVPAELLVHRAGLRRESLVRLHEIEIARLPAGFFQRLLARRNGPRAPMPTSRPRASKAARRGSHSSAMRAG